MPLRRSLSLAIAVAIILAAQQALADDDTEWTTSTSGGSEIEIPTFMTEGWVRALMMDGVDNGTAFEPEEFPVRLRQYGTNHQGRPFAYLQDGLRSADREVTYKMDRERIGVISGYTADRTEIFYGMCKRTNTTVCFDIHYKKELQGTFGPIVERIAKSFRRGE